MTEARLGPRAADFWAAYLDKLDDPAAARDRLWGSFRVGDDAASADTGAQLILAGAKTATSSLLWGYESSGEAPPEAGSLSILEDGAGAPVCVVETTRVEIVPFADVEADFAADYGEWDGTLTRWRRECWAYYAAECRDLGREPADDMPLVCEWFEVVDPG